MRTNFHLKAIVFFIFLVVFWIFFKGLKNDNTYVPNSKLEKEIPKFVVKLFDEKNEINSEKIFKGDEFYLMNIWSSWCVPCKYEHEFLVELSKQKNLKIIDLTGAGDLFAAGYLHGLINNKDIKNCLEQGTEMSSRIIQKIGARL